MTPIENLRFIRIIDPVHIPRHLVEQVRDRDFSVDAFYDYQKNVCVEEKNGLFSANPFNLLFVIVDDDNKVQGFLWAVIDTLCSYLCINTFSMEPTYWGEGKAIGLLEKKAREIFEGAKLSKVYWITNCPRAVSKYNFKRSRSVLMEYRREEDGQDFDGKQCATSGNSADDESRANELHTANAGADASTTGASSLRESIIGA